MLNKQDKRRKEAEVNSIKTDNLIAAHTVEQVISSHFSTSSSSYFLLM